MLARTNSSHFVEISLLVCLFVSYFLFSNKKNTKFFLYLKFKLRVFTSMYGGHICTCRSQWSMLRVFFSGSLLYVFEMGNLSLAWHLVICLKCLATNSQKISNHYLLHVVLQIQIHSIQLFHIISGDLRLGLYDFLGKHFTNWSISPDLIIKFIPNT